MSHSPLTARIIKVVAASTANVTIATGLVNGATLDGITLATGDLVLLKDQTTATENGVYRVVASGAAPRASVLPAGADANGRLVYVRRGTANGGKHYAQTDPVGTVGTSSLTFTALGSSVSTTGLHYGLLYQEGGNSTIAGWTSGVRVGSTEPWYNSAAFGTTVNTDGRITITQSGRYRVFTNMVIWDMQVGATLVMRRNGTTFRSWSIDSQPTSADHEHTMEHIIDLTAGDVIDLVITSSATTRYFAQGSTFGVQQLATSSVVDPNLVAPTTLRSYRAYSGGSISGMGANTDVAGFNTDIDNSAGAITRSGASFTVPAGRWQIDFGTAGFNFTDPSGGLAFYQIVNASNVPFDALGTTVTLPMTFNGVSISVIPTSTGVVTFTSPTVIKLRCTSAVGTHALDNAGRTFVQITELPAQTVARIDPDTVVPTSLRYWKQYAPNAVSTSNNSDVDLGSTISFDNSAGTITKSGASITVPAGTWEITWGLSVYNFTTTGAYGLWNIVNASNSTLAELGRVEVARLDASTYFNMPAQTGIITFATPTVIKLRCTGMSSGTAQINSGATSFIQIKELPASTVIDPGAVTVNDQAASGYVDLGGVRYQWGSGTTSGGGVGTITLPAAFLNTSYSVAVTPRTSADMHNIQTKSTSGFSTESYNYDGNASANAPFDWIAIGQKP